MSDIVLTLEPRLDATPVKVSPYIWRSWTGRRYINGREAHGPVFTIGGDAMSFVSVRACGCDNCNTRFTGWRLS